MNTGECLSKMFVSFEENQTNFINDWVHFRLHLATLFDIYPSVLMFPFSVCFKQKLNLSHDHKCEH